MFNWIKNLFIRPSFQATEEYKWFLVRDYGKYVMMEKRRKVVEKGKVKWLTCMTTIEGQLKPKRKIIRKV